VATGTFSSCVPSSRERVALISATLQHVPSFEKTRLEDDRRGSADLAGRARVEHAVTSAPAQALRSVGGLTTHPVVHLGTIALVGVCDSANSMAKTTLAHAAAIVRHGYGQGRAMRRLAVDPQPLCVSFSSIICEVEPKAERGLW
jgi:hypothetical protein